MTASQFWAAIADVHVGNHQGKSGGPAVLTMNTRCQQVIAALAEAVKQARHCSRFYVVGDLFDNEKPTPQMIAAVASALRIDEYDGPDVCVLLGNHDRVSALEGDHALGWLAKIPRGRVFEQPATWAFSNTEVHYIIPFQTGPAAQYIRSALAKLIHENVEDASSVVHRVLFIHAGICDPQTEAEQPWAANADDAIRLHDLFKLCYEFEITHVYAGNWHKRGQWTHTNADGFMTVVTQIGALVPTGWDNPGLNEYGGLEFFECGAMQRLEIPGPRFITETLASLNHAKKLYPIAFGANVYLRVECSAADVGDATARCESLQAAGVCGAWTLKVDTTLERASAQAGARVASSAATLNSAVRSYIDALTLPPNVDRVSVLNRCAKLLGIDPQG